jgi:uncharacterized protein YkwD
MVLLRLVLAFAVVCVCDAQSKLTPDQKDKLLLRHNQLRCIHGSPPLAWSDAVAADAQTWADGGNFEHSPDSTKIAPPAGPAGENVGTAEWDTTVNETEAFRLFVGDVVDGWYDEVRESPLFTLRFIRRYWSAFR